MKIYKIYLSDNYQFVESNSIFENYKLCGHDYSGLMKMSFTAAKLNREFIGEITVLDNSSLVLFSQKALDFFPEYKYVMQRKILDYYLAEIPIIDALDYEHSSIEYFRGTNDLKRINNYVFKENKLTGIGLFTLPIKGCPVFATELFVNKYKKAKFSGLDFAEMK
jgi:hypothetical protein